MRTIFVYFAIALLLLCPYNCAVKRAAAQAIRSKVPQACCEGCLAQQRSVPKAPADQQPPNEPEPAESGRSCFCEGAAFDAQARVETPDPQSILWTWVIDPRDTPATSLEQAHGDRANVSPPDEGGLATRIALCSLLL